MVNYTDYLLHSPLSTRNVTAQIFFPHTRRLEDKNIERKNHESRRNTSYIIIRFFICKNEPYFLFSRGKMNFFVLKKKYLKNMTKAEVPLPTYRYTRTLLCMYLYVAKAKQEYIKSLFLTCNRRLRVDTHIEKKRVAG